MKNEHKRNMFAIIAHFLKGGTHKDRKKDKKHERRRARKDERRIDMDA